MKRKVRSYLVFTSRTYRLLMFLLVPIALVLLQSFLHPGTFIAAVYLTAVLLTLAEVILDYWVFGGTAVKDGGQLEYLKSSARGRAVIRDALAVNMQRQFLEGVLLLLLCVGSFWLRGDGQFPGTEMLLYCLDALFLGYFFTVAELTIARFFDGIMVNVGIACIGCWVMAGGIYLIMVNNRGMLALLLLLSAAASVIGVKVIMGRVEESYYDKTA